ncbi:Hypothetical predicted protein [Lecanosticta acicola]|uniref:Uncharacterized protein n=1 Tax=Lecanosticta acicola TaxID=111012 RepID=A0AAI8YSS8_9PEZI|nr:Hypothetical predicted protein [Lecanosticta acicola]
MAASGEVFVSDLLEISAEQLKLRGVIKLKDPENLTDEHMKRLQLLANGLDDSRVLDLEAVNQKLCDLAHIVPTTGKSRLSQSPTPEADDPVTAEEYRLQSLNEEHRAYHSLLQAGGRPSHRPHDDGFDYLNEPQTGIIWYWITTCPFRECIFQEQRAHWEKFREHQDFRRARFWKPRWFGEFARHVALYRQQKGFEGQIDLLLDRKQQSQQQDWAEFQYWEHKKADRLVQRRELDADGIERQEKTLQIAINAGEPAEKIEAIRNHLEILRGRHSGAERDLQRQTVLLNWIDGQLPMIASECQGSLSVTNSTKDYHSPSNSASSGKRKRSTEQTGDVDYSDRRGIIA